MNSIISKIDSINEWLESLSAPLILHWAAKTFGNSIAITSSFQTQSLPLLHLVSRICPNLHVYFLDTNFHFDETISYRELLVNELGINVETLRPILSVDAFLEKHGMLYKKNPSMCCYLNKVEPLQCELNRVDAWISGVRRDQTSERCDTPIVAVQPDGKIKICPLAPWEAEDVERYIERYNLPRHPLWSQGYRSIGCKPCTAPVDSSKDPRAGRWQGFTKTECGLHYNNKK